LRAGFAEAVALDATEEVWGGLVENLMYYMREKLRAGEVGVHRFAEAMAWLRRLQFSIQHYILAVCMKR
jgi:hypothetical protein